MEYVNCMEEVTKNNGVKVQSEHHHLSIATLIAAHPLCMHALCSSVLQAHLRVCVRPLLASPDRLRSPPISLNQLTSSIHHPPFLQRVTVAACGGRVEGRELRSLPEPLQLSVTDGAMPCSKRVQEKALDVLMWAGLVHCSSAEGGGYALMSDIVGRLLVSLIHACFVEGDRLLSHKCSQLIIMLYR